MQQSFIETPTVTGHSLYGPKPDAICPSCGAKIYSTIMASVNEQMSASKQYCEDCINKLDTPDNRFRWLTDNDLQAKFLEWYFAGENERDFNEDTKAAGTLFIGLWHKHRAEECDGYLRDYINYESSYTYTEWLLQTN